MTPDRAYLTILAAALFIIVVCFLTACTPNYHKLCDEAEGDWHDFICTLIDL